MGEKSCIVLGICDKEYRLINDNLLIEKDEDNNITVKSKRKLSGNEIDYEFGYFIVLDINTGVLEYVGLGNMLKFYNETKQFDNVWNIEIEPVQRGSRVKLYSVKSIHNNEKLFKDEMLYLSFGYDDSFGKYDHKSINTLFLRTGNLFKYLAINNLYNLELSKKYLSEIPCTYLDIDNFSKQLPIKQGVSLEKMKLLGKVYAEGIAYYSRGFNHLAFYLNKNITEEQENLLLEELKSNENFKVQGKGYNHVRNRRGYYTLQLHIKKIKEDYIKEGSLYDALDNIKRYMERNQIDKSIVQVNDWYLYD